MIPVTDKLSISERDIELHFIRASGPGGQNVNKVATAVQLRFNVVHCHTLPDDVKAKLKRIAGKRVNEQGDLIIEAKRFRTQSRNREDAIARLVALIQKAAAPSKVRHKTAPTLASKTKRLEGKRHLSSLKRSRSKPRDED